jgi:methylphosphotriester-DNA--protein-cysteine methyltransferase
MGKYIPVEPEKWAEMVKAMADNRLLKAEVERLTSEVSYDNRVQLHVDKLAGEFTQAEVERLKAEVERLRKHGDAMAEALEAAGFNNARDFWNAAKEGKQP